MSTWFTGDTHFGHKNIIEFSNRPYVDIDHMNHGLVKIWNTFINPSDTVWHLGDVAHYKAFGAIAFTNIL